MTETMEPVVVQHIYPATISQVWNAITNPDEMRQWFFEAVQDFEPVTGFETEFDVHVDEKTYRHIWKITAVENKSRIEYDWSYAGIPGKSMVSWELSEVDGQTQLQLTHTEVEPFQAEAGDQNFTRESCLGGWNYFLKEQLVNYLEK